VAKSAFEIAVRPDAVGWTLPYDDAGIHPAVTQVQALNPALVGREATGGLQAPRVAALAQAGLPVVVIHPRQAREFAQPTGRRAKTDRVEARLLARLGEALRPEPRPLQDAEAWELSALLSRRRPLVEMLTAEQNRLPTASPRVQQDLQAHLLWLRQRRLGTGTSMRACGQAPWGGLKTNGCAVSPGWGQCSRARGSPSCLSLGISAVVRSLR
jgi:transposase